MNKAIKISSYIPRKLVKRWWFIRIFTKIGSRHTDIQTRTDDTEQKVRSLLKKYGQNTASYLTLESDKLYFFGTAVDGVIGYGIVNDVIVVHGDPVCADKDFETFLAEFKEFCMAHGYSTVFLNITPFFLKKYHNLGFAYVKSGDEARFDLLNYNTEGRRAAKLRGSIRHAQKTCTVFEYKPLEKRDYKIELQIQGVSDEWFETKKTGELIFSLGGIGLDNPMDKRYFYAATSDGTITAFTVFLPFVNKEGRGYTADITRRKSTASRGVTALILYEALVQFKKEGIRWGSLGVAPLANITSDYVPGEDKEAAKMLKFIYEKMNTFYGFKDLLVAKKEYVPSFWEPNFYAYWPRILSLHTGYAIVTIQNPRGIADYATALKKKNI